MALPIVAFSDTRSQPGAMVVETFDAVAAGLAMVGARRPKDVACGAELVLEAVSLPHEQIGKALVCRHFLVRRDLCKVAFEFILS